MLLGPCRVTVVVSALAVGVVRLASPSAIATGQQAPPPAQQRPQTPVFRGGIDVVPITVTVTDRKGMPINGLTQKDFRVIENGSPREIVGFFPQTLQPGEPSPPVVQIGRAHDARLEPATRRMFLIVLAYGRIQEPAKAIDGAIAFVRKRLLPQDAVAVLAFHRVTTFTTDHDAIANVLARYKKEHERLLGDIRQFFVMTRNPYRVRARLAIEVDLDLPVHGGPELPEAIQADIDRSLFNGILPASALRNSAELLLGMDLASPGGDRSYKRQYVFAELLKELQGLGLTLLDAVLQSSPLKLFAGIEHLRFMDGEKHLIYLGGSPPIAWNGDLARLFAARANDARVVVDYVWTSGTSRRGTSGCPPCRDLVELTGGYYSSVEMAESALTTIDQRSRSFYLLGYVPVNTALDGQYRHVRVEVNRPNVTVNHRHGYFASEDTPPLELKEFVATTRTRTLAAFDEDVGDIRMKVDAAIEKALSVAAPQHVRVDISLDVSTLGLSLSDGVHTGRLEVTVYCGDQDEKVIGETKVGWNIRADNATLADWLKSGLQRTLRVPITGKPKFAKVIVYDPVSDRTGSMSAIVR